MRLLVLNVVSISILILPILSWGSEGLYLSTSLGGTYITGSEDAMSAMTGVHIGLVGGIRIAKISAEFGFKQTAANNSQIGNSNYKSSLKDFVFLGGVRLFATNGFSINTGIAVHELDIGIKNRDDLEDDGRFIGMYLGMGIFHELSSSSDIFWEGNLYPITDVSLSEIDFSLGLRFYL